MFEDLLHLLLRLPFPIQIGLFIFVAWLFNRLFGNAAASKPTDAPAPTDVTNYQTASTPPELPKSSKRKKKQGQSRVERAAAEAAKEQASIVTARAELAERAVARMGAAGVNTIDDELVTTTLASNIRRALKGRGAREAFILAEILGKPKSAE